MTDDHIGILIPNNLLWGGSIINQSRLRITPVQSEDTCGDVDVGVKDIDNPNLWSLCDWL